MTIIEQPPISVLAYIVYGLCIVAGPCGIAALFLCRFSTNTKRTFTFAGLSIVLSLGAIVLGLIDSYEKIGEISTYVARELPLSLLTSGAPISGWFAMTLKVASTAFIAATFSFLCGLYATIHLTFNVSSVSLKRGNDQQTAEDDAVDVGSARKYRAANRLIVPAILPWILGILIAFLQTRIALWKFDSSAPYSYTALLSLWGVRALGTEIIGAYVSGCLLLGIGLILALRRRREHRTTGNRNEVLWFSALGVLALCHAAITLFLADVFEQMDAALKSISTGGLAGALQKIDFLIFIRNFGWVFLCLCGGALFLVRSKRFIVSGRRITVAVLVVVTGSFPPVLKMATEQLLKAPDWLKPEMVWHADPDFSPLIVGGTGCGQPFGPIAVVIGKNAVFIEGEKVEGISDGHTINQISNQFRTILLRQENPGFSDRYKNALSMAVDRTIDAKAFLLILEAAEAAGATSIVLFGRTEPPCELKWKPLEDRNVLFRFYRLVARPQVCGIDIGLATLTGPTNIAGSTIDNPMFVDVLLRAGSSVGELTAAAVAIREQGKFPCLSF